jgi:hypothetical protein
MILPINKQVVRHNAQPIAADPMEKEIINNDSWSFAA